MRKVALYSTGLLLAFYTVFIVLYLSMQTMDYLIVRENIDIWFDSDVPRVYENMTILESGHGSTFKHPLFSIITLPITKLVNLFFNDYSNSVRFVLVVNAVLAVLCLWVLARRLGLLVFDAVLVVLLFLSSAGFMFWFGVPETFSFGATSILISLIGATLPRPVSALEKIRLALFSVASLTMTITNWVVGLLSIISSYGLLGRPYYYACKWRRWHYGAIVDLKGPFIVAIFGLSFIVLLSLVQNIYFGDAGLFFNIFSLLGESRFIGNYSESNVVERFSTLWTGSVVAGSLTSWSGSAWLNGSGLNLDSLAPVSVIGRLAQVIWIFVLSLAIIQFYRKYFIVSYAVRGVMFSSLISILFFTLMHLLYGSITFLYTAHFLPLLMVPIISLLVVSRGWVLRLLLVSLIVVTNISNMRTFQSAVEALGGGV